MSENERKPMEHHDRFCLFQFGGRCNCGHHDKARRQHPDLTP